nr:retrovirus-related Pol polyprotein from transposon TNT 1-94 [Tanacetum cinerariifolium]
MSQDVLTVGSTMRISLLYRGEYSQLVERLMNYLEEQTDGEAMINSIKNGDQPLPRVTQVSIAGTTSTEQPPLKDKSMWSDQEKRIQKIDRLARSLLIQGLSNDIYSLIDSNKTAKDLWDVLSRQMLGSEYGVQDRKAAVLYEYETFKATEGELLLDTYIRYLQVISDLKKCGYSKDNCVLNFKFLNNLQPEWKQYAIMMRHNKNLTDMNIDALYNILKQNQGDVNDAIGSKRKTVVVNSDPLALIAEKTNVSRSKQKVAVSLDSKGSEADDFSELKKITALLEKAFNQRKFYSKPTNNNLRTSSSSQSANKKQEFVKTDNKRVEKKDDEKKRNMSRVKCYNCKKEGHFAKDCKKAKVKDYEYYKTKMMLPKKDKDEQVLLAKDQAWMESSSDSDQEINANMVFMAQIEKVLSDLEASSSSADEKIFEEKYAKLEDERYECMIRYSTYFDNDKQHRKQIDDQQVLYDKMSVQLVELDKHVRDLKNTILEKDFKIYELEECNLYNGRKGNGFENPSYFEKAKDLRPTLYDEKVIGLGHTPMFFTHSDETLEIEKFKRSRENKIKSAYDYENLNASYVNEKINLENDYFQEIINPDFEKIDSPFHQTSSLKLYVLNLILKKIIIDLEDEVVNLLEKEKEDSSETSQVQNGFCFKQASLPSSHGFVWTDAHSKYKWKRYVLVVVDDYSQYTWVQRVRTDNGTKFKNKTLAKFFDKVGITQQFSSIRKPQQNGVMERRNRTLVEVARTMLTFANLPSFLWAEAIATACFTQNRSIIHKHFDKTPYELINKRKPNIKFFRVFGCRCYLLNDYKDIGKLKAKGDMGVFVGYSKESATFKIYNKRTQEVILPHTNTQSIPINMIPNGDEASTSHNVFNERLEDAYFDASTSFHDQSNVHSYYQPYPHEKKWTKDHPFHKIIGDSKSTLRDADWFNAMQEELEQFARLKQHGKSIIALYQALCESGLQSQPLIMPENGGIANLALQGGSGD